MRFLGKWLIWIGGGALLYVDLRPLLEECLEAWRRDGPIGPYTLEEWLLKFARPVFVLGILCATALPELGRRSRKTAPKPREGAGPPAHSAASKGDPGLVSSPPPPTPSSPTGEIRASSSPESGPATI